MRSRSLYLLLVFAICTPAFASGGPSDAIVTIWTDLGHGRRALGTGFLTSSDGQVMTAYHVIQHARGIQVLHSGNGYSNIIVEAIAPEHDLARLKIVGFGQPASYLRLVFELPQRIQDEELFVFGHGGGISNQRLVARMTRPEPTLSGEIRGPRLERLFRLEDVRLLPLQATIYDGISGGPVLSKHGVIGILSGSIGEGGTIAWAIPAEYARPGQMRVLNKPVRDIRNWPELTLMAGNWKNLRKSVLINEGLAQAIERYFVAVDDLAVIQEKLPLLFLDALVNSQFLQAYVEQRADMPLEDILEPNSYLVQNYEAAMKALNVALTKERPAAHIQVGYHLQDLIPAVSNLTENDIAKTQKNYWINKELIQSLTSITAEGFDLEALERMDQKALEMAEVLGKQPESTADFLALLRALEDIVIEGTKPAVILELNALIGQFRRAGHVVEGLLIADFEGKGENWSFTSDREYEIHMLSGWEFVGPGDADILQEDAEAARANNLELDAVFRNRFGEELGLQNTVVLKIGIVLDLSGLEITDDHVLAFNQGLRRTYPDAKSHKKTIGNKQMLVGQYVLQQEEQQWIVYYVIIPHNETTIWLQFHIPAERAVSLLPQCEHVLGRISFK